MSRPLTCSLFLFSLLFAFSFSSTIPRKQLAGSPDEFKNHSLPSPTAGSLTTEYDSLFIFFQKTSNLMTWQGEVQVDSTTSFSLILSTPHYSFLTIEMINKRTGQPVALPTARMEQFPIGQESVPTAAYAFGNTLSRDAYVLTISGSPSDIQPVQNPFEADGLIISHNESPIKIYTNLVSYKLLKGDQVGIQARIYNSLLSSPMGEIAPVAMLGTTQAKLEIELPNGTDVIVDMHDDGLHSDLDANDGVYGATIAAPAVGQYIAEPKLSGLTTDGATFKRSSLHLFHVVDVPLSVSGAASGVVSGEKMNIYIPIGAETPQTNSYRPYAQVWGKNAAGADVPVCWISTISDVVDFAGNPSLQLQLDLKWVKLANAQEPLTLKEFYVQELNNHIPLVQGLTIPIKTKQRIQPLLAGLPVKGITKEMREGKPPVKLANVRGEKGKLVLLHGYCSERNPWQQSPDDWTNPAYFLNPKASISNDEFAKKVADFTQNFESFSLIGHSQGGLVATHLHNYYFTGLEAATGGRLIQSVGTPYHGNTVAGVGASLGSIFGVGCGSNSDLTKDGAELWLKGITAQTKDDVHYYTTTYPSTGDKYCNWAINLLLKKPNDGTSELALTVLDGGSNMGTTEGWCHVEGMHYTAQYYDHTRNKEMNANAAR